ncbi:HAD family hydrolase [Tichowtungia aerotolerans]|uniref:HAD-IA family hydrolase n=1 Tax=Tichowtungia aerotolerans TaxID=2697043 RepID=A0A6P1MGL9_9BACT|nr:HAD family phosphatase [Tichowtungia aerotolerans]QHI70726.1 HAD-IA family hydrolase [Tichowtungia aerotolerans]
MSKAYIFDMDGVLCDSEPFIAEAAVRMFKETHEVDVPEEDFLPFVGSGEDRYIGGVAEKHGIILNLERDKAETYRLYGECVKGKLQALPGVKVFIESARAEGILLAVATSADEVKLKTNLHEMDLDEKLFDALVNGLEIEHKKPAPDIFLEAARRLGVDPADATVFEDAVNGVQAAKAAGAHCVGITSSFTADELLSAGADETRNGFE